MNNVQEKAVKRIKVAYRMGEHAFAAGFLSALIRGAKHQSEKDAMLAAARDLGIASHPEFII